MECAAAATGVDRLPVRAHISFTIENGEGELAQQFSSIELRTLTSELVVDVVDPVLDYARSMSAFVADDAGQLDGVLRELEQRVTEMIAADGALHITTEGGCFVCR